MFPSAVNERSGKHLKLAAALIAAGLIGVGSTTAQQTSTPAAAPSSQKAPAATHKSASSTHPAAVKAPAGQLATDKQKQSYSLGTVLGKQLAQQKLDEQLLDLDAVMRGFKDGLAGSKLALSDEEINAALTQLQSQSAALIEAAKKAIGEANLKEGQDFLAKNKTQPGVVELPSGLQYKIITTGTGPTPTASDTVVCDYRGTLINGKEFDSSYKRGQPATFPVSRVIKGWTEALQLMPVGSKWQLFIPSNMAYGATGAGADIGPNATLIFEVELHSIKGQ